MDLESKSSKFEHQVTDVLNQIRRAQSVLQDPHKSTAYLFKKFERMGPTDLPSPMDLGIVGKQQHNLNKRVDKIEQELNTLEYNTNIRLNVIEQKLNIPPPKCIVAFAKAVFTNLKIIEHVYIMPISSGFRFIIIHNAKTAPEAIVQTRPGMNKLEDEFPDLYFERLILHSNEVRDEHLQQAKLVLEH